MSLKLDDYEVKFADTLEESRQVRQLRYRVFCEEDGAIATPEQKKLHEEYDFYDTYAKYLIILHKNKVIGSYRIIDAESARKNGGFYSETEFDISKIKNSGQNIVELSRACIEQEYRKKKIPLWLLWAGLNRYIMDNKIDISFGMVSWKGTNPLDSANAISYLYHNRLSPIALRATVDKNKLPKDINQRLLNMNILQKNDIDSNIARKEMPPLLKGYLDLNATFGDGIFIDKKFNSYEVLTVLQTRDINPKFQEFFTNRQH